MDSFKAAHKKYRYNSAKNVGRISDKRNEMGNVIDLQNGNSPTLSIIKKEYEHNKFAHIFLDNPGFVIFSGALCIHEQINLIKSVWSEYPDYPASTNLTLQYGNLKNFFHAYSQNLYLKKSKSINNVTNEEIIEEWGEEDTGISAINLLKKLRWISLGPSYDWTARKYNFEKPYKQLPSSLNHFFNKYGNLAMSYTNQSIIPDISANIAIINIYYKGHYLCGHKDDGEINLTKPIVNISLGCPAIFLMGGIEKSVPPTPVLLRTGDIVVMSGHSRLCFHGISHVFTEEMPEAVAIFDNCNLIEYKVILERIKNSRINISMRSHD